MATKVVFVHDHVFKEFAGHVYSSASLSYSNMRAYRCAGNLTIIGRGKKLAEEDANLSISSGEDVDHVLLPNIKSPKGLLSFFSVCREISRALDGSQLVIARLPSTFGLIAYRYAKKKGINILVEVVGNAKESLSSHGSIFAKILSIPVHHYTKKSVWQADHVTYITKGYLQSIYPASEKACKYVCSNALLEIVPDHMLKQRLDKGVEKSVNVGLIGSLDVSYKGHETAIRAIGYLNERHPDISWVLNCVGAGDSARWKELARNCNVSDKINFKGPIKSGEAIFSFIDEMDIMFQPSLVEGQGRSIIEAMSRGCPVIATNVGGIVELYDNRYMVDVSSPEQISDLASKIVFDKSFRSEIIGEQHSASQLFSRESLEKKKSAIIKGCLR